MFLQQNVKVFKTLYSNKYYLDHEYYLNEKKYKII